MRNEQLPQQSQPQPLQINEEFIDQLKTLMKSKNAMQYLTELASVNPQFKTFFDMARTGNLQPVYENLARQYNIDPKWLLNKLLN